MNLLKKLLFSDSTSSDCSDTASATLIEKDEVQDEAVEAIDSNVSRQGQYKQKYRVMPWL